jgi:hypothetical protein
MRAARNYLITGLAFLALAGTNSGQDQAVNLVRIYKTDSVHLIELSSDGRWMLTEGARRVDRCEHPFMEGCFLPVLSIYETSTGTEVRELTSTSGRPTNSGFDEQGEVIAVEEGVTRKYKLERNLVKWDPASGTVSRSPLPSDMESRPVCVVDDQKLLGLSFRGGVAKLEILDSAGSRLLKQPGLPHLNGDFVHQVFQPNCRGWRSGASYLIEGAGGSKLHWVSTDPSVPASVCASFPDERIHGYAVSPDRGLIVVVTGRGKVPGDRFTLPPPYHTFLNLLDGSTCAPLRKIELTFPEEPIWRAKAKDWDDCRLAPGFATHIAISPDKTKVALAYGVKRGDRAVANFGLFSLPDGKRLATVAGDSHQDGESLGHVSFSFSYGAQTGAIQFSPDSRTFYASSIYLRQWDISAVLQTSDVANGYILIR